MFAELADTTSPYFSRRVKILETVSRCKCCVILLDIDCNDLVMEMFNIFFSVVRSASSRSHLFLLLLTSSSSSFFFFSCNLSVCDFYVLLISVSIIIFLLL